MFTPYGDTLLINPDASLNNKCVALGCDSATWNPLPGFFSSIVCRDRAVPPGAAPPQSASEPGQSGPSFASADISSGMIAAFTGEGDFSGDTLLGMPGDPSMPAPPRRQRAGGNQHASNQVSYGFFRLARESYLSQILTVSAGSFALINARVRRVVVTTIQNRLWCAEGAVRFFITL